MRTTTHARTLRTLGAAALAIALGGCVLAPPAEQAPPSSDPSSSPVAPPSPSESAALEGPYDLQNDESASVVWSFEATDAQRVETDANGNTAAPGYQLVILHLSGELLRGEPDFYYQFRVHLVDVPSGLSWGLSSGSSVYAEDDLFMAGRQPSFVDADAIYQVPDTWALDTWRITCNETGEVWDLTVPVS